MQRLLIGLALAIMASVVVAEDMTYIDIEQAKSLYDDGAQFVDTRTWAETKFGIVKNAKHLPHDEIDQAVAASALPDKLATLVLYCRSSGRASMAAQTLKSLGYENVRVFGPDKGFDDWSEAGLPTE